MTCYAGTDRICSYLPLTHIMERSLELGGILMGSSTGYYAGDMLKVKDDFADV